MLFVGQLKMQFLAREYEERRWKAETLNTMIQTKGPAVLIQFLKKNNTWIDVLSRDMASKLLNFVATAGDTPFALLLLEQGANYQYKWPSTENVSIAFLEAAKHHHWSCSLAILQEISKQGSIDFKVAQDFLQLAVENGKANILKIFFATVFFSVTLDSKTQSAHYLTDVGRMIKTATKQGYWDCALILCQAFLNSESPHYQAIVAKAWQLNKFEQNMASREGCLSLSTRDEHLPPASSYPYIFDETTALNEDNVRLKLQSLSQGYVAPQPSQAFFLSSISFFGATHEELEEQFVDEEMNLTGIGNNAL